VIRRIETLCSTCAVSRGGTTHRRLAQAWIDGRVVTAR